MPNTCECGVCAMLAGCRPAVPADRLLHPINQKPYNPQINYALIQATKALHRMEIK